MNRRRYVGLIGTCGTIAFTGCSESSSSESESTADTQPSESESTADTKRIGPEETVREFFEAESDEDAKKYLHPDWSDSQIENLVEYSDQSVETIEHRSRNDIIKKAKEEYDYILEDKTNENIDTAKERVKSWGYDDLELVYVDLQESGDMYMIVVDQGNGWKIVDIAGTFVSRPP